ncbi:MAG: RNase adapter RapZ [Cardiobacteriaceae bacterium]|nr:RNase adapter RapZ [Cardiobacteriaceae bacterium]
MIIVTGLAGAGKSSVLHALEDLGYYCLDNLPSSLLRPLLDEYDSTQLAVAMDSRNPRALKDLPQMIQSLRAITHVDVIFLTADNATIARRFAQTRRPHPLHIQNQSTKALWQTIDDERLLLEPLADLASLMLDTSDSSLYQLKDEIHAFVALPRKALGITIQSFGFKHGVPQNTDYVFDVRFLPNPYWQADLRECSGLDTSVQAFFSQYPECMGFIEDADAFLQRWLPFFMADQHRAYLTISVGCTGGQHRSVYVAEHLGACLSKRFEGVRVYHRDMKPRVLLNNNGN